VKDLPNKPVCPKCGSPNLGVLRVEEKDAYSLVEKRGAKLAKHERKLRRRAEETSKLLSRYGKAAAVVLSGRNLKASDAKGILTKEGSLSDELFELVVEAERDALKRRFL